MSYRRGRGCCGSCGGLFGLEGGGYGSGALEALEFGLLLCGKFWRPGAGLEGGGETDCGGGAEAEGAEEET